MMQKITLPTGIERTITDIFLTAGGPYRQIIDKKEGRVIRAKSIDARSEWEELKQNVSN